MVYLKFIIRSKDLTLRISSGTERYYKSVKKLLKGKPNINRHWDEEKERFSSYAVLYTENNKILDDFKERYRSLITKYPELSAKEVAQYYSSKQKAESEDVSNESSMDNVEAFLKVVIEREKAKQGCNFEVYYKLYKKCRKIVKSFPELTFQSIDYDKCVQIAYAFAKYEGYKHTAKTFRSLLGKASKDANVNFSLSQIGDFKFRDYNPKINEIETKRPDVLSPNQLNMFLNLDVDKITPTYKDRKQVQLFYDFSVFMYYSFFSPCDIIKLKHKEISPKNTIRAKRKKTHKSVEVPVNPEMQKIINRYYGQSRDGYVFPIKNDEKEKMYKTRDHYTKKFKEYLNNWLKCLGKELNTDFALYAYVFRHTGITFALDNNIPIAYVAGAAGTSIEMIQKHYYNGNNDNNMERLQNALLAARN